MRDSVAPMPDNVAAIRAAIDRLNDGDVDGYMSLYADDAKVHGFPPGVVDKESLRRYYTDFLAGFEHLKLVVEHGIGEGDLVAGRFIAVGRHRSGHDVRVEGQSFLRFTREGKIAERWQVFDNLGFMQQLGRLPGPAAASA